MPLKSTRVDVEELVGKAKWSHGSTFIYETPCGRLDVLYSRGVCKLTDVQRWNVPEDYVIRMEFAPRRKVLVKDLNLSPNRFVREQESHPKNWVQYRSAEDGIRISAVIGKKGDSVMVISYEPKKEDDSLRCASTK